MFQFPRLPSSDYVFTAGWRRITGAGFPHSEIRGSKTVQRLTAAYRSRPRPSSTPGAKASTVSPYYLDGERPVRLKHTGRFKYPEPTHLSVRVQIGLVQFSRSTEAHATGFTAGGLSKLSSVPEAKSHREPGRRSREISLERR
jgi:hypothetical protein